MKGKAISLFFALVLMFPVGILSQNTWIKQVPMAPVSPPHLQRNAHLDLIAMEDSSYWMLVDTLLGVPGNHPRGIHLNAYNSNGDPLFSKKIQWEGFIDGDARPRGGAWLMGDQSFKTVVTLMDDNANATLKRVYTGQAVFKRIVSSPDGGFALLGCPADTSNEIYVMRSDAQGLVQWAYRYQQGAAKIYEEADLMDCAFLPSGRLLVAYSTDRDARMLLLDDMGLREESLILADSLRLHQLKLWEDSYYLMGQADSTFGPIPVLIRGDTLLSTFTRHYLPFSQFSFTQPLMDCNEQGDLWISWGFKPSIVDPYNWIFARFANDLSNTDHFTLNANNYPGNTLVSDQVFMQNGNLLVTGRLENPQQFDEDLFLMSVDSLASGLCWLNPSSTGWQNQPISVRFLQQPGHDGGYPLFDAPTGTLISDVYWMDSLICGTCTQAPEIHELFLDSLGGRNWRFAASVSGLPEHLSWSFGDGDSSGMHLPEHRYLGEGSYRVCLYASNACGVDSLCDTLTLICPSLSADFSWQGNLSGGQFSDLTQGNPLAWTWDFGDGNGASISAPSHTYANPGTYQVCLTVNDSCSSDTYCDSITVLVSREEEAFPGVKISPNPVQTWLNIDFLSSQGEKVSYRICNVLGECLLQGEGWGQSGRERLNVQDLPAGLYFLTLSARGRSQNFSILKM